MCTWSPGNPSWQKLSPDDSGGDNSSGDFGAGDSADELAVDFKTLGLWVFQHDSTPRWHKINGEQVFGTKTARIIGSTDYELIVYFSVTPGLWMWNYNGWPGQWTRLTSDNPTFDEAFCEPFDPDGLIELSGQEELSVDFNELGLWLYDYSATKKWKQLSKWSPRFMVKADLNGMGVSNCLVCDFRNDGLWYYNGQTETWHKISPDSPDP
jgi:hypothetical protein